jgi:hypothetical protein
MYDYEDMVGYLNGPSTSSVAETILKFLEEHIYANPEQWYQWKQYLQIKTAPGNNSRDERPASPLVLKRALDSAP